MAKDSKKNGSTPTLGERFASCVDRVRAAENELQAAIEDRNGLAKEVYDARKSDPFTGPDGNVYVAMIRQTKSGQKDDKGNDVLNPPVFFFKAMSAKTPTAL